MKLRPIRCLLFAVSVAAVTFLVVGYLDATGEGEIQRWEEQGLDWLVLDAWGRAFPWRAGAFAAVVALGAMLVAEGGGEKRLWFPKPLRPLDRRSAADAVRPLQLRCVEPLRRLNAVFGHVAPAVVLLGLALGMPRLVAHLSRPAPPEGSPNLLFVLVDTWRADHAGFLGYERNVSPNLDELATSGVVFERAISQSGWTKPAVATLLTGLIPSRHMAVSIPVQGRPTRGHSLPRPVTTLVEILAARGWDTAMWSANPNIVPHCGFAQGAGHFVDYFYHPERTREYMPGRIDRMLPDVRRWLAEERDPDRPFCAYVHVMDPHYAYEAPAPFAGTFDHSGLDFNLTGPLCDEIRAGTRSVDEITEPMRRRLIDAYDEELLFVDHHLGALLDEVRERHPNTVIVVVGDHGDEFLEHGQYGHAFSLYETLVHVPLLLWAPELAPSRVPSQVRLMDVFPTLLELVGEGLPPTVEIQGESLLPVVDGRETAPRLAPMESGGDPRPSWQWRAICDGRLKLIRREADLPDTPRTPSLEEDGDVLPRPTWHLYDLLEDPGETRDLFREGDEERARALFETMEERGWYVPPEAVLRLRTMRLGPGGHREALRDLGYAGDEDSTGR